MQEAPKNKLEFFFLQSSVKVDPRPTFKHYMDSSTLFSVFWVFFLYIVHDNSTFGYEPPTSWGIRPVSLTSG